MKSMRLQAKESNNLQHQDYLLLTVSTCINFDLGLRRLKKSEQLNRTEVLLLCRIHMNSVQKTRSTKRQLLKGWRVDYARLNKYLERLTLLGYVRSFSVCQKWFGRKSVNVFELTIEGKRIIKYLLELLNLTERLAIMN
jgi:hypothetical protein